MEVGVIYIRERKKTLKHGIERESRGEGRYSKKGITLGDESNINSEDNDSEIDCSMLFDRVDRAVRSNTGHMVVGRGSGWKVQSQKTTSEVIYTHS
jgi:hypothetical protein